MELIVFSVLGIVPSITLLIIIITAIVTTKVPILLGKGFWSMAHEARTDFAMTVLLIH